MKSPIPDVILDLSYLKNMSDKIIETQEPGIDIDTLPLLIKDGQNKIKLPIEPNWQNLAIRMSEDKKKYEGKLVNSLDTRGGLGIEAMEYESIQKILSDAGKVVYEKDLNKPENALAVARYLDWSYQEQVGVPASSSNQGEAEKVGVGAREAWALFTNIKNNLSR